MSNDDAWNQPGDATGAGGGTEDAWAVPTLPTNGTTNEPTENGNRDRDGENNRDRRSRSPRGRSDKSEGQANPGNNLHVSGLNPKVDNRDLENAFGKYGKVAKAQVMIDPHTRESRGFGFVTMETAEDADAAIAALNGSELNGRNMTVERARRGRARTPTPGRYYGPPKRDDYVRGERPYEPRSYDSRYSYDRGRRGGYGDDYERGGGGGGGAGGGRDYERGGRDYDRGGRYEDRGGGRYEDRRYEERGGRGYGGGGRRDYDRDYDRRY